MKKQYVAVLFTLICVLGLGLGARAQEEDTVVAKVPYDFLVGGRLSGTEFMRNELHNKTRTPAGTAKRLT